MEEWRHTNMVEYLSTFWNRSDEKLSDDSLEYIGVTLLNGNIFDCLLMNHIIKRYDRTAVKLSFS
jgi:hypothetical protein